MNTTEIPSYEERAPENALIASTAISDADSQTEEPQEILWEKLTNFEHTNIPVRDRKFPGQVIEGKEHIALLHRTVQKVQLGSDVCFLEKLPDSETDLTKQALKTKYMHLQCVAIYQEGAITKSTTFKPVDWFLANCPPARIWRRTDKPRLFREEGELFLNPFAGFPYAKSEVTDEAAINGKLILDWIFRVICSSRKDVYEFLLDFIAQKRQKPFEKIGKIIALSGPQGSGKGTFFEKIVGGLFPKKGLVPIRKSDQIQNQFNEEQEAAHFIFFDEAIWSTARNSTETLKGFLNPKTTINRKHRSSYVTESFFEVFIASNRDDVAPVELGDRRYLVLSISKGADKDAFQDDMKGLHYAIENEGLAYLDQFFRERKVSTNFNEDNCIPLTREKFALLVQNESSIAHFMYKLYLQSRDDSIEEIIPSSALASKMQANEFFRHFQSGSDAKKKITLTEFGKYLRDHFSHTVSKDRESKGKFYCLDFSEFAFDMSKLLNIDTELFLQLVADTQLSWEPV